MKKEMILTRFLYCKDEVELSLMMALLKNEDVQIIYYWAYELYYSGFAVFDLLIKIYLDFYYEKQPYLLNYIKKKQQLWTADGDMKHVAYVLRNLQNLNTTNTVFMARQYMFNYKGSRLDYGAKAYDKVCDTNYDDFGPTILYKFKKLCIEANGVEAEEANGVGSNKKKPYKNLILALNYRHMENVWYYLKTLLDKGINIVELGKVVGECLGIVLLIDETEGKSEEKDKKEENIHYIIACIVNALYKVEEDIDMDMMDAGLNKHIFIVPKKEHLDYMITLETAYIPVVYDTLIHKRLVTIDTDIGNFALARWQWTEHTDFVREIWFHWEYYAMGSPLWQKRLVKWGGVVNHITKTIEFPTEEMQESFYELYAYEFDELPKEVQAMSLLPLNNTF